MFECDDGYQLRGPKMILCSNGTWTPAEPPVCKELYHHIGCYSDGIFRALPKFLDYVTTVRQCYELAGARGYTVFATQYGRECWSGKNAAATYKKHDKTNKCRNGMGARWANDVYAIAGNLVNCTEPPALKNGKRVGSSFGFQQHVKFQCKKGYDIFGASSITCLLNGKWSALPPTCEAPCRLTNPQNGVVIGNSNRSRQNVTFQCNKGFKLEGESRRTCKNGNWSHDIPKCSPG